MQLAEYVALGVIDDDGAFRLLDARATDRCWEALCPSQVAIQVSLGGTCLTSMRPLGDNVLANHLFLSLLLPSLFLRFNSWIVTPIRVMVQGLVKILELGVIEDDPIEFDLTLTLSILR